MGITKLKTVGRINRVDAAKLYGTSARHFDNRKNAEYPPPKDSDGTYDLVRFGEWLRDEVRREWSSKLPSGDERLDPTQESARKNKELADKTALENQVRRGELIETDDVENAWTDILARVRARMLRLPSAAAPLVLGEDDQVTIQTILEETVRDALSEMSVDWRESPITELPK